ncbi:hypothetical protein [Terribacillus halophilus]|uniref:hypothetical protein n=1 Tax=Terribacillus halophilus TaxID=361279 RepID=UPI00147CDD13|nr:hypothetical protein [Terribacillus halophilus]
MISKLLFILAGLSMLTLGMLMNYPLTGFIVTFLLFTAAIITGYGKSTNQARTD